MNSEVERLLTGKKRKWKIIDSNGKTLEKGFRTKGAASDATKKFRLTKYEKFEVVPENG